MFSPALTHPAVRCLGTIALSIVFGVPWVQAAETSSRNYSGSFPAAQNSTLPVPLAPDILTTEPIPLQPSTSVAQAPNVLPRDPFPARDSLPEQPLPQLPPPEELLPLPAQPPIQPELPAETLQTVVYVEQFEVVGSTVFSPEELAAVARQAIFDPAEGAAEKTTETCPNSIDSSNLEVKQKLSFEQLLRARTAITQLYINCGFITSGAILPEQTPEDNRNIVKIQIIEGSLEKIEVIGTRRLNSSYIRDRLAIAGAAPLNRDSLLRGLQLLQLKRDLIRRIAAELQAGTRPGTNILQVEVTENADTFNVDLVANNSRSPSVGSFERGVTLREANLLGAGDALSVGYRNTDGSNGLEASYEIPINPRDGSLQFRYSRTSSNVVEDPFDLLGIEALSNSYEITARQPLYQTPNQEFALSLTASHQESQTSLSIDDIGPSPLSPGADEEGRTRISAVRFTQEWVDQSIRQVLAARSQFSLGLDFLDATVSDEAPDSRFFAWRGQGQWVRLLAKDMPILIRTDLQLTGDALVPLEQFGLGGLDSLRGYRQDALLTDNGVSVSAELRLPILRVREWGGILQIVPFIDAGTGWNVESQDPDPRTLVGTGLGLRWEQGEDLTIRLEWGIPLVSNNARERTWQESGVYFSVVYSPF